MTLTSLLFFTAFILSLAVYYLIPARLQWILLILYSFLFFCVFSEPVTLLYLVFSVIVTTLSVRSIVLGRRISVQSPERGERRIRAAAAAGIILDLIPLIVLKYSAFFVSAGNGLAGIFGIHDPFPVPGPFACPIGISFYTLQIIAYILDSAWGIAHPETGFLKNALFIGYWPQLTSGPIARHRELKDQLYSGRSFNWDAVTRGLQRMLWGIFKKLVLSSRLGILVDTIYGDIDTYGGLYIWLAMGMFLLQLYTDFSGCMDIVLGASECYGIKLPENFRTPFFSRSVQEYWQRWHITLGLWLKDYILYPFMRTKAVVSLNKALRKKTDKHTAGRISSCIAMLPVWLLIGLWHGGAWKYVLGMGVWFWLCIALGQLLEPSFKKMTAFLKLNTNAPSWHVFQSVRVFILASIGNVFFRIPSLKESFAVFRAAFRVFNPWILFDGSLYRLGLSEKNCRLLLVSLILCAIIAGLQEKANFRGRVGRQNPVFRYAVWIALICAIAVFGLYGPGYDSGSFIYQQF